MGQYNWSEIKAKYETGKYTMKQLAQEYGFNAKYGARKANKNNWEKGKTREKVEKKIKSEMMEEEVNKETRIRKEYEQIITNIRRMMYKALVDDKNITRIRKIKLAMQTIRDCRSEQWEVNEILEVAQKAEFENQEDKLEEFVKAVNQVANQ